MYEPGSFIPLAQIHLVKDYVDPFQEKTETGLLGKLFGGSSKTSKDAANDAAQTQQVANGVHESAPQAFYTSNHERITPKHYPNGKTFILHYQVDQLGTPQLLHDDDGNMHWLAYYQQAWGEIKPALSGLSKYAKIKNPLRFQGQYFDEETGLHYNRHRYYDPHSGRFISQDPIGLAGGLNLYAYAPNPTGYTDALGLQGAAGGKPGGGKPAGGRKQAPPQPENDAMPCCIDPCKNKPKVSLAKTKYSPLPTSGHLYRGVSATHPALADAKKGIVRPALLSGGVSSDDHNAGGNSGNSQYTSWSHDINIAKMHANKHGPGGVILSAPVGAPGPNDCWSWHFSEDRYGEQEMLLQGVRSGLGVHKP